MKLNHINLPVNDVGNTVSFFEQYFGFTCTEVKGDFIIAVLKGADDFILVLMKAKETAVYPQAFHIGFLQETKTAVDHIFNSLQNYPSLEIKQPGKIRDSYGFYFDFDCILIEVSTEQD
jgi:catechol-2,3-dioxygenase